MQIPSIENTESASRNAQTYDKTQSFQFVQNNRFSGKTVNFGLGFFQFFQNDTKRNNKQDTGVPSGYFAPSNIVKVAFNFATESKEKQNIPNVVKRGFSYTSKPWQQNGKALWGRLTKIGSHSGDENCIRWSLYRKSRRFVAKMWRPERRKNLSRNLIF